LNFITASVKIKIITGIGREDFPALRKNEKEFFL
jgi:hypothetical protein